MESTRLALGDPRIPEGHAVDGRALLPGAQLLWTLGRQYDATCLTGVEFRRVVDDGFAGDLFLARNDEIFTVVDDAGAIICRGRIDHPSGLPRHGEVPELLEGTVPVEYFYEGLAEQGNEYSGAFRSCVHITCSDLATVTIVEGSPEVEGAYAIIDGCFQSLLVPAMGGSFTAGAPVVLASADRVELAHEWPNRVICRAELTHQTPSAIIGDIEAWSEAGERLACVRGLRFARVGRRFDASEYGINVAGSFTLEPLAAIDEHVRELCGTEVGLAVHSQSSPERAFFGYDGAFSAAPGAMNVYLLRARDVLDSAVLRNDGVSDEDLRTLPNGIDVAEINRFETQYLYREIFEDRVYARHGIAIRDGDTVIDVGANIGLFSLFALHEANDVTVHAFEPSPAAADRLRTNLASRGNVHVNQAGAGAADGLMTFTYYPNATVFSRFGSDREGDRGAIRAVVANALQDAEEGAARSRLIDDLCNGKLIDETLECPLIGLAGYINRKVRGEIGLLKIDAEGSELSILESLPSSMFERIRQVMVEVHGHTGKDVLARVQRILRASGFEVHVDEEVGLAGSGLYLVAGTRATAGEYPDSAAAHPGMLQSLRSFLALYAKRSEIPLLVLETPELAELRRHPPIEAALSACKAALSSARLHWVDDLAVAGDVRSEAPRDALMPYSRTWYARAYAQIRAQHHASAPPLKVVVTDADGTLWRGVCGEDGPWGVGFDEAHLAYQRFLRRLKLSGVILALCSKNTPEDVKAVFDQRSDMPIGWEDFSVCKVGWSAKSASIRAIAEELNLSPGSMLFVDDNPVECVEVECRMPEVDVLRFQSDFWRDVDEDVEPFELATTAADSLRAEFYEQGENRQQIRLEATSMEDYLVRLQLKAGISRLGSSDLQRAAQMLVRTTQFNSTRVQLTESELSARLEDPRCFDLVADASDRYGDYGTIGLLLSRVNARFLVVESLVMSCRALGRGIEHRLLREVASHASALGVADVVLTWVTTDRNEPFRRFLSLVSHVDFEDLTDTGTISIPVSGLVGLPDPVLPASDESPNVGVPFGSRRPEPRYSEIIRVAALCRDGVGLAAQVWPEPSVVECSLAGATVAELSLGRIWAGVLRCRIDDVATDFFELGGTSLQLVDVLIEIQKRFGVEISLADAYANRSVRAMATLLPQACPPEVDQTIRSGTFAAIEDSSAGSRVSEPQRNMWVLHAMNPESHAYNVSMCVRLRGRIDETRLFAAVQEVISRHPVLNTIYRQEGKSLVATSGTDAVRVSRVDGRRWSASRLTRYVRYRCEAPFDLQREVVRVQFIDLGEGDGGALLLSMHHIAADLASMEILLDDLEHALADSPPRPATSYDRFLAHEANVLTERYLAEGRRFWSSRLEGQHGPPVTPTLLHGGGAGGFTRLWHPKMAERLRAAASERGVSRLGVALAALFRAVHVLRGETRIRVATPMTLRHAGSLYSVGNHVAALPVCLCVEPDEDLLTTSVRVDREIQAVLAHRHFPLYRVWSDMGQVGRFAVPISFGFHESLRPGRDLSFLTDGLEGPRFELGGMEASFLGVLQQAGQFPLAMEVCEVGDQLALNVKMDGNEVDLDEAVQLADLYEEMLEACLETPVGAAEKVPMAARSG